MSSTDETFNPIAIPAIEVENTILEAIDPIELEETKTEQLFRPKSRLSQLARPSSRFSRRKSISSRPNFSLWDIKNHYSYSTVDGQIRIVNDWNLVVALLCITTMMIQNEVIWNNENEVTALSTALKALVSVGTIIQIVLVYFYYHLHLHLTNLKRGKALIPLDLWSSRLWWRMALEMAVCAFHVPPLVDVVLTRVDRDDGQRVTLNMDVLGLFLFLRLYLCVRVIHDHSLLRSLRGRAVAAARNETFGAWFAIKTVLKFKPFTLLLACYFLFVMAASWVMHVCERFYDPTFHYLPNAIWVILITMATVGYGDLYPVSICGRSVSVLAAFVGLVISALLVTILTRKITLDATEAEIVKTIKTNRVAPDIRDTAALVIQSAFRYSRAVRNNKGDVPLEQRMELAKLVKNAELQKLFSRELRNIEASAEEGQDVALLSKEVCEIRSDLNRMQKEIHAMHQLLETLAFNLSKNQA